MSLANSEDNFQTEGNTYPLGTVNSVGMAHILAFPDQSINERLIINNYTDTAQDIERMTR